MARLVVALLVVVTAALVWPEEASSQHRAHDPSVAHAAAEVDDVLEAAWAAAGMDPRPPADELLVARRMSLALTGAVPSLEEIRAFEARPEGERLEAHLDQLLQSRRYADYVAERLARVYVGTQEAPFLIFRRRRFVYWLSDNLHQGRPYDDMVRDMVAGTGLWTDKPGVNFLTAQRGEAVPLTGRSTRAFLGMRLDCAQCHDHPFSHWKQTDFMGLAAFFGGIDRNATGVIETDEPFVPGGRMMMDMGAPTPESVAPAVPFAHEALPAEGSRRERLAAWLTSPDNPYFARAIVNRMWTLMFGRTLNRGAVDDLETPERVEGLLDVIARDFVAQGYDLRHLIRVIAATRAFRMSTEGEVTTEAQDLFAAFPMTPLRPEQIAGSLVQLSDPHTVDAESHFLWRLIRFGNTRDFSRRYGDAGEDELQPRITTITQRLVMMNGNIVNERIEPTLLNAAGRLARMDMSDARRVDNAFLMAFSRRPTEVELAHFVAQLAHHPRDQKAAALQDVMWSLINATEFSWNH